MFQKIVLASDLSAEWDQIVACTEELRALGCSRVILTHVIVTQGLVGSDVVARTECQPKLDAQKGQLEAQGFEVLVETPVGLPAFALNDVAQRHCASLIVVGSHGKSAWREALLGSVSNALLHQCRFPVLLLNLKLLQEPQGGVLCQLRTKELLRHVLFPTDFSTVATTAAAVIERLAEKGLSELTLLHALEVLDSYPPAVLEMARAAARGYLDGLEQRFKAAGIRRVHSLLSNGHPVPMVLDALKTGDFSLVVMGTQGKSFLGDILLGSVAYNVARLAPSPVLLIPRSEL